jgi:hypothetical protein
MPRATRRHRDEKAVRDLALAYPEAHEDFPWGHRAIQVRRKVFVIMSNESYRAIAPKRLVARLDVATGAKHAIRAPRRRSSRSA